MKIINLIKCEFIKNYTLNKIIMIILASLIAAVLLTEFNIYIKANGNFDLPLNIVEEYGSDVSATGLKKDFFNDANKYRIELLNKALKINNIVDDNYWQLLNLTSTFDLKKEIIIIQQLINNHSDDVFIKINNLEYPSEEYEQVVKKYFNLSIPKLKEELINREELLKDHENIIDENKYYKYLELLGREKKENSYDSDMTQFILDKKIEDLNDYRVLSYNQKKKINEAYSPNHLSLKDYNLNLFMKEEYGSYESYVNYQTYIGELQKEKIAIIDYSIENNIKHDLTFNSDEINESETFISSKTIVNKVLSISFVVILILTLMTSGIVSNENTDGTDKLLLTSPIRRWKILLSKFIYLIINTYIIWFILFFFVYLYAGVKLGFSDLMSPKLIYENGVVVETSYLLYIIKQILICNIPIIAFASIMFAISTISLSTPLTMFASALIGCTSSLFWYFIGTFKITLLAFLPFPYFDYSIVLNDDNHFLEILKTGAVNDNTGMIVCFITIIVMFLLSTIIYSRKDIKDT